MSSTSIRNRFFSLSMREKNAALQALINSPLGVGLALGLGRILPPSLGLPLARRLADRVARQSGASLVKSVRLNQWVIRDKSASSQELDESVSETFRQTAKNLYNLYHHLDDQEYLRQAVCYSARAEQLIADIRASRKSVIVAGVHLSNFDLVARVIGGDGLPAQVLSFPQPGKGYRWQNQLRQKYGLEITPASITSLRQAVRLLKSGGSVVTGLDRPVPGAKLHPAFFGVPSDLPFHHIQLAIQTGTPIIVAAVTTQEDGRYFLDIGDSILMQPHEDRQAEILLNAERVLKEAETRILQAPHQWAMFYPVWPQLLEHVPYP